MSEDKKIKVLCVEDEQDIRDTMAEILRDEGFEVFEADNGKKGFDSYMQNKPDIIVSDIMMPEVDGYALLKMVRESKDKRNTIPFIFLSALGQKENILKGADLFANDYLVKPIDFDILIAKIKEKAFNANRVQKTHDSNIKNLKEQISVALPSEIFAYLDNMTQMLQILKEEPYGPFPHRRYSEDINKIYFDCMKLRAAVTSSIDHEVIDKKLDLNEEIFSLLEFLDQAIAALPEKIRSKIEFEKPYDGETFCRVKMERGVLIELFKRILMGVIKVDADASVKITLMTDSLNQSLVVFFIKSAATLENMESGLDIENLRMIGDSQGCYLKLSKSSGNDIAAIFSIPSHRVVKNK